MNTSNISFRSFTHDGDNRLTAVPSLDGLRLQDHLVQVLDSIKNALVSRPLSCELVLSVENTEPFHVEWTSLGDTVAVARLIRADTEAVLVSVCDAGGTIDAAALRSLHVELRNNFACEGLDAAFDWLLGDAPPLAALAYIKGKPQIGLDTVAMCLATVFFDGLDVDSPD